MGIILKLQLDGALFFFLSMGIILKHQIEGTTGQNELPSQTKGLVRI